MTRGVSPLYKYYEVKRDEMKRDSKLAILNPSRLRQFRRVTRTISDSGAREEFHGPTCYIYPGLFLDISRVLRAREFIRVSACYERKQGRAPSAPLARNRRDHVESRRNLASDGADETSRGASQASPISFFRPQKTERQRYPSGEHFFCL